MTPSDSERLSLEELCTLVDLPARTVRFYIQEGLVNRPEGAKRGAYYTREHLERLLTIRKWQRAGVSLERIRELVSEPAGGSELPPEPHPRPGDVSVRSHIVLAPGVELVIDPGRAGLDPQAMRELVRRAADLLGELQRETEP